MGSLPIPRFRIYLGTSSALFGAGCVRLLPGFHRPGERAPWKGLRCHLTSGAWQKYSYSWRHGIIWAECAKTLTKENPYDYDHFVDCTCIPYRHAHGQTTCLRGADRTPSDQSPASGAACQGPFGDGCWSQQQPDCTPDAPQPWDRVRVAPSLARPDPEAGPGGSGRAER